MSKYPQLLFTDGACEEGPQGLLATCGAVLFDRRTNTRHVFGVVIGPPLLHEWCVHGKRQVVTEAELLPILLAKRLWADRLRGAKVLTFVDSEPAKHICVAGFSRSLSCDKIVKAMCFEQAELQMWEWFTRVPTESNPADEPSRLKIASAARRWQA
eukprot:3446090-Amphidinium_carterae.1